nr:reverse transcriptase domain-containing protein [Tanacetum cinerariifolium]
MNTTSSSGSRTLPSNTITNPKEDLKGITTRSGIAYKGPTIPTTSSPPKQGTEVTKDQVQTLSSQSTAPVQPPVVQSETQTLISKHVVAPVSVSMPNLKPSIPYPSRHDNKRCHDQADEQIEKFYKIFKDMKWVQAKALPTNDARVVCKFLKSLFPRFGTPRAIISDRGTHFCNDQFVKVMLKYGVTHRLATAYHPQTSREVEISNRGLKRILERTVGKNRASWLDKLDDALWAFRTAFKTPIGRTPYKLVY